MVIAHYIELFSYDQMVEDKINQMRVAVIAHYIELFSQQCL